LHGDERYFFIHRNKVTEYSTDRANGTLESREDAYRVWKGRSEGKLPFTSPRNRSDNINNDPIVVVTEIERCVQMD
jgi:hypothetical protein